MKRRLHSLSPEERRAVAGKLEALLAARDDVQFAFLHGSFVEPNRDDLAAGEALPFEDIDVAVHFTTPPSDEIEAVLQLGADLSDQVGIDVDVQVLNSASLGFRFHATRGRVIVCRDEEALAEFRERTWLQYWDYEPLLRQNLADLLAP